MNERPERPDALDVQPDAVPTTLREKEQWVAWRYEYDSGRGDSGEWTKVPIDVATGSYARSTDGDTWTSFTNAVAYHGRDDIDTDGVGFVVHDMDFLTGVDLDDCRDPETGDVDPWAADLLADVPTYAEVSPSGTGLRLFGLGFIPDGGNRGEIDGVAGHVEMYETGRYLTVTGHHVTGAPQDVREVNDEITDIHAEYIAGSDEPAETQTPAVGSETATPTPDGTPDGVPPVGWTAFDDDELIEKIRGAGNATKFSRLFDRGSTAGYPSRSEADSALCWLLSYYSRDPEQIDRLFRRSALMRSKWDERHYSDGTTYGERTVEKAVKRNPGVDSNFPVPEDIIPDSEPDTAADGGRNQTSRVALTGAYRALVTAGGRASTSEVADSGVFDRNSKSHARRVLDELEKAGVVEWSQNGRSTAWKIVGDHL